MRRNIASEEQNAKNIISQPAFLFFLLLLISLCSQLRAGNFDLTHIIIHDTCTYQLKSFVKFKFRKFLSCTAAFLGILRIIAQDRARARCLLHKLKSASFQILRDNSRIKTATKLASSLELARKAGFLRRFLPHSILMLSGKTDVLWRT